MPRLLPLVLLVASACADRPAAPPVAAVDPAAIASPAATAPYDFNRPTAAFRLDRALVEISGLAVRPDGRLAAIEDERGVLYTLDPTSGAILAEHEFAGRADYEGVEWAAGAAWVLQSNGHLFEIPGGTGEATEHETPLKKSCDAEGLALDAAGSRLLVACKEDPGEGLGDVKTVYAFSLATRTMDAQPAFVLDRAALDGGGENFKPSALAIHPRSGALYVLSSVRKALAVVAPDGQSVEVIGLSPELFRQPEGLAFLPDGTLLIASEGAGADAMLFRFTERR